MPRWLHCSPVPFHFTASVPLVLEERSGFQAKGAAGGCQAGVLATGTQKEHISMVPLPTSTPASIPVHCWRLLGHSHDLIFTTWDQCPWCFGRCIYRERPTETKDLPVAGRFNKKGCSFVFDFFIDIQKNIEVTDTDQDWCGWLGFTGAQCLSPPLCNDLI